MFFFKEFDPMLKQFVNSILLKSGVNHWAYAGTSHSAFKPVYQLNFVNGLSRETFRVEFSYHELEQLGIGGLFPIVAERIQLKLIDQAFEETFLT